MTRCNRKTQFVVVTAGCREFRAAARHERHRRKLDLTGNFACGAHMPQIRDKPIRNIDRCACNSAQRATERNPWFRQVIPPQRIQRIGRVARKQCLQIGRMLQVGS